MSTRPKQIEHLGCGYKVRFAPDSDRIADISVPIGRADGGREFLFFVADVPDAHYFARCVLDRVMTGHVRFAEDVDFAVESLTFVDLTIAFPLGSRMVPSARPCTLPALDTRT